MNYLGHIYLSGDNEHLLIGNFIGDYVKGRQYENYPEEIKRGILLHRAIDEFTDSNANWIEIKELLKPIYKRYAGVVADIFLDHFLAKNFHQFSEVQLSRYAKWVYAVFLRNFDEMPQRVQGFVPYLIQHRRLQSYAKISGLDMSLQIMAHRTSLPDHTEEAIKMLKSNYEAFKTPSLQFLAEVKEFTRIQI